MSCVTHEGPAFPNMEDAYYLADGTWGEEARLNAGNKARDDVNAILDQMGLRRVNAAGTESPSGAGALKKLLGHRECASVIREAVSSVPDGSVLIAQFPLVIHTVFFAGIIRELQRRGVRVVLLLHDVELLRFARSTQTSSLGRLRISIEEKRALSLCDAIVVHNDSMARELARVLEGGSEKMVSLRFFDYLCEAESPRAATCKDDAIVVAGNLAPHKAGYLYDLAALLPVRAYGVGLDPEKASDIDYRGSFGPEELPGNLRGSFGLVWDGPDTSTCSGAFGEYLTVNNPHKTSLYLASGLPVLIWDRAALAPMIVKEGAGLAVSSLEEVPETIGHLTAGEYEAMTEAAQRLGERIRGGWFTRRAMEATLGRLLGGEAGRRCPR